MISIFLFLAGVFLATFLLGRLLERIRVPWIFAALLVGFFLAMANPFSELTSSSTFVFLSSLGMYFLLFIIGFEIDLRSFKKAGKFIVKSTFFIIFFEALFGTALIYFVFGYGLLLSFVVALSFATVGEAILIPILDEFKLTNTKLGQTIIGLGTLDDVIELLVFIFVIFLIGSDSAISHLSIVGILLSLGALFLLTFGLTKLRTKGVKFYFSGIQPLFVFMMFLLFLFLGLGDFAQATPIAAFLAGISLRTFIPDKRLDFVKSEIRTFCYGFFAPLFFLSVGLAMNVSYLFMFPLLIVAVVLVSNAAKLVGSYLVGHKELGTRESILLGIGLSVRFSTSLIIVKLLLDRGLIGQGLYTIIIASSFVFNFIVPLLFSALLVRWKIARARK